MKGKTSTIIRYWNKNIIIVILTTSGAASDEEDTGSVWHIETEKNDYYCANRIFNYIF